MKTVISIALVAVIGCMALSGCAKKDDDASTNVPAAPQDSTKPPGANNAGAASPQAAQ